MRLINDKAADAFSNMATDEAIMQCKEPTLRFYSWNPPAVSLGYFQSLEAEVNALSCKEQGVDIVRRITGGGAVFHDCELTYSLIVPENMVDRDIVKSYEQLCGAIVRAMRSQGHDAVFHPINDILVSGKKVSGNAQTRRQGMVLQHGTILLGVDVDKMFSLLKVPDEKLRGKVIENARERVAALAVNPESLKKGIISGLAEIFGPIEEGILTGQEKALKQQLILKYKSTEWNQLR